MRLSTFDTSNVDAFHPKARERKRERVKLLICEFHKLQSVQNYTRKRKKKKQTVDVRSVNGNALVMREVKLKQELKLQ